MRIYLAGGLRDGWQDKIAPLLQAHVLLDPRTWQTPIPAEYTARDLAAIKTADCVIAYMDAGNPSGFGLSIEVGFARALGIPVIFVDALGADPRARYFDMLRTMSTVVHSLEAAACAIS